MHYVAREETSHAQRTGYEGNHPISDSVIQEAPWNLTKWLEKYSLIDVSDWSTTQPPGTILAKFDVIKDLLDNTFTAAPFNEYVYWRGDIEFKFQVTSVPQALGMVVAVFVPLTRREFIEDNILTNFSSLTVNPCTYMFANTNTAATLTIPFNSPQNNLDIREALNNNITNSLGTIYLVVFNPIQIPTSVSDTATISTFTSFKNSEFKIPRLAKPVAFDDKTRRFIPESLAGIASGVAASVVPALLASKPENTSEDVPKSGSKGIIATAASKLLPGPFGDVLSSVAGKLGLDKPTDPTVTNPVKVLSTQPMNFGDGVETIDKMSVLPQQIFPATTETFASSTDEMSLNYLKKKFSYLGTFGYKTTQAPGTVLASFPANPIPSELFNGETTKIPLLSYLALKYAYYKGGITYRFQIVASSFHTGKIMVALNYGEYSPLPLADIRTITSQYGTVKEINQGSNEFDVTISGAMISPNLYVPNDNIPSSNDSYGYINIVSLNKLVAPNNAPTEISINVYIAAADDFELSTLNLANNIQPFNITNPIPFKNNIEENKFIDAKEDFSETAKKYIPESLVNNDAPLNQPVSGVNLAEDHVVAPNTSTTDRPDTTQAQVTSLKTLLRKYQMLPVTLFKPLDKIEKGGRFYSFPVNSLTVLPVLPSTNQSNIPPSPMGANLHSYIAALYRQFKGGYRFKVMIDDLDPNYGFQAFFFPPNKPTGSSVIPDVDTLASIIFPMSGVQVSGYNESTNQLSFANPTRLPIHYVNGITKTASFEIPYASRYISALTNQANNNFSSSNDQHELGYVTLYLPANIDFNIASIKIFFSLNDEARYGNVFHVPRVYTNCVVDINGKPISSAWPDSYGPGAPISNTLTRLDASLD